MCLSRQGKVEGHQLIWRFWGAFQLFHWLLSMSKLIIEDTPTPFLPLKVWDLLRWIERSVKALWNPTNGSRHSSEALAQPQFGHQMLPQTPLSNDQTLLVLTVVWELQAALIILLINEFHNELSHLGPLAVIIWNSLGLIAGYRPWLAIILCKFHLSSKWKVLPISASSKQL